MWMGAAQAWGFVIKRSFTGVKSKVREQMRAHFHCISEKNICPQFDSVFTFKNIYVILILLLPQMMMMMMTATKKMKRKMDRIK